MSLVDLSLKKAYSSDVDNILYDFYIPVLERATEYDRIAGFFSSSSLAIAARGIVGLIKNNGKMKLIASPKLSKQDIEAIKDGYNDPQKYIEEKMLKELERLEDEFIRDHVFALAWMIANQKLEIKIAIVYDEDKNLLSYEDIQRSGIFHQKVGIIKDEQGNIVSFSGSINESAIGWLGNIEEFKVFRSWDKVERGYLDEDISKFERYWENKSERVKTIYIPYAIKRKLVEIAPKNIEEIQIEKRVYKANKKKIELFEHQEKAIASWIANKMRGIFEMATGTGKTFAALGCLQKLIEKEKGLVTVISCPYGHLVKQWVKEIENFGVPASIVIADSSNPKWKGDLYTNLINTKIGVTDRTIIVTTHNTFSLEEFNSILRETYKDNNLFLIVDEVHGVGAPKRRNGLKDFYRYRLGLSATPKRWFDWEGTDEIFNYFGGVVFRFSLDDAIHTINPLTKKTYLTPYVYKPFFVELTDNEIEEYRRETYKIVRNYQNKSEKEKRKIFDLLCIKRQEIIKNARNKYV
ncbi:MAG: DEAD/DEAH box helicase family protein, partial [Thermoplasmata archaeon]|nr:DEAD/DEAH box helicase family protein [Thermoplasmata archaeon]